MCCQGQWKNVIKFGQEQTHLADNVLVLVVIENKGVFNVESKRMELF